MVAKLILFAIGLGYEVALDDGKCRTGHRRNSYHYKALAQDINLYKRWGSIWIKLKTIYLLETTGNL